MIGSIHSEDRADNEFQARIDQLASAGRPVDRQTMVDLAEEVRIRLGLRPDEPEVLIAIVQQLIDLSQQQQRDTMQSVRPDSTQIPSDSFSLPGAQLIDQPAAVRPWIPDVDPGATVFPTLGMPPQQPFANAPTPNRRPSLASVTEPPSPSLSFDSREKAFVDAKWAHLLQQDSSGAMLLERVERLRHEARSDIEAEEDLILMTPKSVLEAQFASESDSFPREFRWEALQSCYRDRDTPFFGEITDARAAIDVLWLSPTIFVSTLWFYSPNCDLNDCRITFARQEEDGEKEFQFFLYSLPSFVRGEPGELSHWPFQFFRHVTELLPVGYFTSIYLDLLYDQKSETTPPCEIAYMLEFLNIVPNGATQTLVLGGDHTITVEDLRTILAHRFHPCVMLQFDRNPFINDSVPLIEMLTEVTHLRSIQIPKQSFGGQHRLEAAAPIELSIRSNDLTMCARDCFTNEAGDRGAPSLLGAIAAIHNVDDICIKCYESEMADQQRALGQCIRPFLDGSLKTKSLRVQLIGEPDSFQEIKEWAAALNVPCKSKDLTTFNVRFSPFDTYEDELPRNLDGVQQWDAEIFPSLVLNYCSEKLTQQLDDLKFLLAIQSINEGFVYRQVTGHKPHDKSMANASLIYSLLKIKAGETQNVGGGHGE
jgi:hypothetical protein